MNTWHHICKTQSNRSYYVDARTLKAALRPQGLDSVTGARAQSHTGWSLVPGTHSWGCVEPSPRALFLHSQDKWSFSLNTISSLISWNHRTPGPLGVHRNRRARLGEQREQLCAAAGLIQLTKATWGSAVLGRSGAVVPGYGLPGLC